MPRTLDKTYARILCGISDGAKDYTFRTLHWSVWASRPLALDEVAELSGLDPPRDGVFNFNEILVDS